MRGEGVAQRMTGRGLVDAGSTCGLLDRALQYGIVKVMSPRVGKQDHFEQHGRGIGRFASVIIAESILQGAQIQFVVEQPARARTCRGATGGKDQRGET